MVDSPTNPIENEQLKIDLSTLPKVFRAGYAVHEKSSLRVRIVDLWSLHAIKYEGELSFSGQTFSLQPGVVSLTPPNVDVQWSFTRRSPHIYVHFRVDPSAEQAARIPVVSNLGDQFDPFYKRLEEMVEDADTDPLRTNIRLWDVMMELAHRNPHRESSSPNFHPILQQAVRIIRNELGGPLKVSELAERLNVSQTWINSLFRDTHDCTVHEYIQRNRVITAVHLLQNSTRTIKSIANEVGIPNAQHFNKVIRAHAGVSPRVLRKVHARVK
jgi:AraC-like DNA-binding protein